MALIDCSDEMLSFHADEVTLSKRQQDDMRSRRDAGRTRLKNGLKRDGHAEPLELAAQGSYAMRTMIQDPSNDYDIDDGVYFRMQDLETSDGKALAPDDARERVCAALKQDERLKEPATVKTNCVRQQYPEGYHIDMPVYRCKDEKYELASGDAWVVSDARSVTKWFNDKVGTLNAGQPDGSQMRRIVRLTKKYARSRHEWKPDMPSGICITKLVVDNFRQNSNREDMSLVDTWRAMHYSLLLSLRVAHPVQNGTILSDGDNDPAVANLRAKLFDALQKLDALPSTATKDDVLNVWDQIFNTDYFSDSGGGGAKSGGGGGGGPSVVITSSQVPTRRDGDRRFGKHC